MVWRNDYRAFGEQLGPEVEEIENAHAFTGKDWDEEVGLYYFNARWYDPELGRFISEDPVGDPNNPNLYAYARNNPLVVPFTGLLYAYLRTGAQVMERDANISQEVVRIIQAVVILLITAEALVSFLQRRRIRRRGTVELELLEKDKVTEGTPAKEVAGG